jgi:hypothetical protein
MAEPENYDARAEIMWAGTMAHCDILGTGRIGDWASHIKLNRQDVLSILKLANVNHPGYSG